MNEFPRMLRLPPYAFNVVGDIKKELRHQNIDIVDLSMGNPDPPTPRHIVDKMVEAAQKPVNHRYSVSRGIPNLRKAICDWYRRRFGVELNPECLVAEDIFWHETEYRSNFNVKPMSMHHTAGPQAGSAH